MVFIPLYTLAGFYICSPLQCFTLISIYNFHISEISLLSFSVSISRIFHIFHRLGRFSGSNQFPVVFHVRRSSHFPNSWSVISLVFFFARCHFPSFSLFLTVSLYFSNSIQLISLMSCTPTIKFQIFSLCFFSVLIFLVFPLFSNLVPFSFFEN